MAASREKLAQRMPWLAAAKIELGHGAFVVPMQVQRVRACSPVPSTVFATGPKVTGRTPLPPRRGSTR